MSTTDHTGQANKEPAYSPRHDGNCTGQANKEPSHRGGPTPGRAIGDANHPGK